MYQNHIPHIRKQKHGHTQEFQTYMVPQTYLYNVETMYATVHSTCIVDQPNGCEILGFVTPNTVISIESAYLIAFGRLGTLLPVS